MLESPRQEEEGPFWAVSSSFFVSPFGNSNFSEAKRGDPVRLEAPKCPLPYEYVSILSAILKTKYLQL